MRRRMGLGLAVALVITGCGGCRGESIRITAGPQETVALDVAIDHTPDAKYFTFTCKGRRYGIVNAPYQVDEAGRARFAGSDRVFRVTDPLGHELSLSSANAVTGLEPGPAVFDARGVWLHGVYLSAGGVLHGFYHAERPIPNDAPSRTPHKSLAYAESADCGRTWAKVGYPANNILTAASAASDAGDANVLVVGRYLYLFYTEQSLGAPIAVVARARRVEGGRPGTWFKYRCRRRRKCGFWAAGIGGKPSPVQGRSLDTFVTYNTFLRRYLAVDASIIDNVIALQVSRDALDWVPLSRPLRLSPPPPGENLFYPSIIALGGDSAVSGQSFWLYYTQEQQPPGTRRSLHRVRVTLHAR